MFSGQMLVPLVVIGLVVGLLVLSGLASRHQQHQAARRSIVQRMEASINRVELALDGLRELPLNLDLRQALRRDVLDRYRMIAEVFARYPDLASRLQQAEGRLNAEVDYRKPLRAKPGNDFELQKLIRALDDLKDYLKVEGTLHPIAVSQRQQFALYLGEHAAVLLADYYHAKFARLVDEDKLEEGRTSLKQLMALLRNRGPDTERVRELYHAAQAVIKGGDTVVSMPQSARQAS